MLQCILAWTSGTCGMKTAFFVVAYHQQHYTAMTAMHNCTSQGIIFSLAKQEVNEKSAPRDATLRAGCSEVKTKFFRPAADPLPGGAGRPKFNHLEMIATFTYKSSLVNIDARNFELSW